MLTGTPYHYTGCSFNSLVIITCGEVKMSTTRSFYTPLSRRRRRHEICRLVAADITGAKENRTRNPSQELVGNLLSRTGVEHMHTSNVTYFSLLEKSTSKKRSTAMSFHLLLPRLIVKFVHCRIGRSRGIRAVGLVDNTGVRGRKFGCASLRRRYVCIGLCIHRPMHGKI